jgi:formylmethanofuran dehydrogenase subunit D
MPLDVTLITGRTIAQGEAIETGKELDAYTDSAGICELDPIDMKKLGAKEGDTLKVSTEVSEVFVKAVKSSQKSPEGLAFIPLGPWANAVIDFDTSSTGMPSFKGVKAVVELAKEQKVLGAKELVRTRYAKYKQV